MRKLLMCRIIMSFAGGDHHSCIRASCSSWSFDEKKIGAPVNLRMKIERNHHQVPPFYLDHFQSDRRRSDLTGPKMGPVKGCQPRGCQGHMALPSWSAEGQHMPAL